MPMPIAFGPRANRIWKLGFDFSRLALVATHGDLLGRACKGILANDVPARGTSQLTMARSRARGFTSNMRQ